MISDIVSEVTLSTWCEDTRLWFILARVLLQRRGVRSGKASEERRTRQKLAQTRRGRGVPAREGVLVGVGTLSGVGPTGRGRTQAGKEPLAKKACWQFLSRDP